MDKNYDPNISQNQAFIEYVKEYETNGLDQAHDLITLNNYDELPLKSSVLNQIIKLLYSGQFDEMQSIIGNEILAYISTPPQLWVKNSSYKVGDIIYYNSEMMDHINNILYTDTITQEIIALSDIPTERVYYCIKNIGNSINLENTEFWRKIPNYYLSNKSLDLQFQLWINRLQIQNYPTWQSNVTYYKNNIVKNANGDIGICITTNKNGTTAPLNDINNWLILDLEGRKGTLSLGVNWRGSWVGGQNYDTKDMVTYSNGAMTAIYIAKRPIANSTTIPQEGDDWMLVLQTGSSTIDVVTSYPANLNNISDIFIVVTTVSTFKHGILYRKINNGTATEIMYPEVLLSKVISSKWEKWKYIYSYGTPANGYSAQMQDLFQYKNLNQTYMSELG